MGENNEQIGDDFNNDFPPVQHAYRQNIRQVWFENHPEWREFLVPDPNDPTRIRCVLCNPLRVNPNFDRRTTLVARLEIIQRHLNTRKHLRRAGNERQVNFDRKVAKAVLKISAIFAEHNLAFLLADHMIYVMRQISDDPECRDIWNNIHLDRHNVKDILMNCIGHTYKKNLSANVIQISDQVLIK